ncbi:nucleoid occlusion protein [Canicola haemoglobinophilus]|uniref:Nucleoid occlusion protein n=1 Tax=Canicola haemoglobinophilus TaxID=733 RepID=A0AB38H6D1_9PAST|nr:YheU family protein [Canicola haemoglobinophilus]STO54682.1 nucleoid occlusion protein [Canicola haemoglobinophilus]STO67543.1 nucleoid occlusion protein [Canicola haemoglobinophilus]
MLIPWEKLEKQTLFNILESFILREGTDYGSTELSLAEKRENLFNSIRQGKAVIVWSELHQSIDIKDKMDFFNGK